MTTPIETKKSTAYEDATLLAQMFIRSSLYDNLKFIPEIGMTSLIFNESKECKVLAKISLVLSWKNKETNI